MSHRLLLAIPVSISALAVAAAGLLYGRSEWRLRQYEMPPPFTREIPTDLATVSRGERLARTRGCHSCHGDRLEGRDFSEEWSGSGRVIAPNLARYARDHDPATIERAVRHGIGQDGRALWSMPAYNFRRLADDDLVALIAYLRSHPVFTVDFAKPYHSVTVRLDLALGGGTHMADWAREVPALLTDSSRDSAAVVRGEYLAMTSCNECHGLDLRGVRVWGDTTPDLAVAAGYSAEEFARLLREGVARDGRRDLGLMTDVATRRFVHLRPQEVRDLHAFLSTLPTRPVPTGIFWRQ